MKLYLASQSPRRLSLLQQIGYAPEIIHTDVPEVRAGDETPAQYGARVALMKAKAGWQELAQVSPNRRHGRQVSPIRQHDIKGATGLQSETKQAQDCLVLGADTEVVLDDMVFGKPKDASEACEMLARLSNRTHEVITAVAVVSRHAEHSFCQRSSVRFKPLSAVEIQHYVATGEAFGKAGAYAIQGIASCFIELLAGSFSGVMGLPVHETHALLNQMGLRANWQHEKASL
jgi:septum formation protein